MAAAGAGAAAGARAGAPLRDLFGAIALCRGRDLSLGDNLEIGQLPFSYPLPTHIHVDL